MPYNDVEDTVKEIRYNQGYLAMIKYNLSIVVNIYSGQLVKLSLIHI